MSAPEAFELLSLPNAVLSSPGFTERGVLCLECVTVVIPEDSSNHRDVYLVLRLNSSETPIDPARVIQRTDGTGVRTFTFYGTQIDPTELVLTISVPRNGSNPQLSEDLDTFEGILTQYADLRRSPQSATSASTAPPVVSDNKNDLRGHLVMIDEDTGEVVGEVEDRFRIKEDAIMHEKGHENDPVVIEVSDEYTRESDATTMEVFARIVPPDQQDWVTKSATVVSHAISMTTNLLLTTITTASNYYIKHSPPSPHHPNSDASSSTSKGGPSSASGPPPVPPRALVFLTSERTRKGLATVHTATGQAVKVSTKTVGLIDSMIRRAMGAKEKRTRTQFTSSGASSSAVPSSLYPSAGPGPSYAVRTPSPSPSGLAPPPYSTNAQEKPALPPRRSPSPAPPLPPRTTAGMPAGMPENMVPPPPRPKLSGKDRVLISADLILSTIDDSARKILDSGTENLGKVVGHKYGPEAAHSSRLMAGSARNIGLVYIDMRGIGRRALLKRAGKTWVKGRISSNKPQETP